VVVNSLDKTAKIETFRLNLSEAIDWERIVAVIEKLWNEPWEEISQRHGDPGREFAMLIAYFHFDSYQKRFWLILRAIVLDRASGDQ
jgi:hypothetical protein